MRAEIRTVWDALRNMQGNVDFVRQEMDNVALTDGHRDALVAALEEMDSLLYDLRTEARNLEDKLGLHPGEPPNDPDIVNPDPRVTMSFLRDWPVDSFRQLHEVVQALEPEADRSSAYLLVAESAANMLNAYAAMRGALDVIERRDLP